MASEKCHTPHLPVELLECIANLLGPNDILSFRLACKTFADIALDRFIWWYMQEIDCFFPDPARVQRLANITSQPHVADRVEAVYLTLDAFEYNDDAISFVAPAHDRGETLREYKAAYQSQQLVYHCARRPNLELLSQSLARLNPMRCELHVDISNRIPFRDYVEWALISQRVLDAIGIALYPIYDLTILSQRDLDQDNVDQRVIGRHLKSPKHVLYCSAIHSTCLSDPSLETPPGSTFEQALATMRQAVAKAQDSESLDIIYWNWPRLQEISFANDVLSANNCTRLRRLVLVHVILPTFEALFQRLRRCENTLEIITLNQIEVSADRRKWKGLFEMLSVLPKLEHFEAQQLWWRRDDGQRLLMLDAHTFFEFRCQESGSASINGALADTLQKGLAVRNRSERIQLW